MGVFGQNKSAFSGAGSDEAEEVFLNLTPMIDIMTCLLFFLLLSFGAVIIALVNASVPVISDGDPDPTVSKLKVTMGLSVSEKGILVTASHDKLSEEELDKMKKFFPKKKDGYDFEAINNYLYTIKQKYPNSSSVIITPKPKVPYSVLVEAMDASREKVTRRNNRPLRLPMFPEAVISTLVE